MWKCNKSRTIFFRYVYFCIIYNISYTEVRNMTSTGIKQDNQIKNEEIVEHPKLYRVLLHNDHYTTMEFVVYILQNIFNKPHDDAVTIMLKVHREGIGVAGVYVRPVAEAKVEAVHKLARENGFPLRCSISPE